MSFDPRLSANTEDDVLSRHYETNAYLGSLTMLLNRAFQSTLAKWKSMPTSEILLVLAAHDFGIHSSTCSLIVYSLAHLCLETK